MERVVLHGGWVGQQKLFEDRKANRMVSLRVFFVGGVQVVGGNVAKRTSVALVLFVVLDWWSCSHPPKQVCSMKCWCYNTGLVAIFSSRPLFPGCLHAIFRILGAPPALPTPHVGHALTSFARWPFGALDVEEIAVGQCSLGKMNMSFRTREMHNVQVVMQKNGLRTSIQRHRTCRWKEG